MQFSIGSWSFHRLLESGQQDMFQYITDCKNLGCTQLDPWNGHLAFIMSGDAAVREKGDLNNTGLGETEFAYLGKVKAAAEQAGLPFGCLAVDGAHIYEPTLEARQGNRAVAYRYLEVARFLGATQIRIDSGGKDFWPDDVFKIVVEGYQDLIERAQKIGVQVLMENHWGPSNNPDNVVKIMEAVKGLGLLFDSNNFIKARQEEGWQMTAKYAKATHFKTFTFDEKGDEPSVNLAKCIRILLDEGYNGCWGVESVPKDGDEYAGVVKTFALVKRVLKELGKM